MTDGDRPPTLAHRAEYAALRGVVAALGTVSPARAGDIGARLGRFGYRALRIRRRVVERQLAAAFPGLGPREVDRLARECYAHLGRTSIEAALLPRLGRDAVLASFEGATGWPLLEAALAASRGAILTTGHLGNWELAGHYLAARGVPIDGIARRMANPLVDRYLSGMRTRTGLTLVHDADAVRRVPRALREGRAVAFLADQGVLGLASTFVPFFGRPAKTPRGPAVFALRLGTPLLFAVAVRQPSRAYRLFIEPVAVEETGDRERDVDRIVARYTTALERWVRRYPEQYFWQHRRWKRQPADTPAEVRDPAGEEGEA
jgi:KDO2-lipid IV(A) lauroyltransferase